MVGFRYRLGVNKALAGMGIDPLSIARSASFVFQSAGKKEGLTPEETALCIAAAAYGIGVPNLVEGSIIVWRHDHKIDLKKPQIIAALDKMGYNISNI